MKLNVALLQFDVIYGKTEANQEKAERMLREAMKQHPDIVILPELWTTGYDLTRLDDIADDFGQVTINFMSEFAKNFSINIIAGSIAKKTPTGIYNTLFAFNREGNVVGEYSKAHLFRLMDEEKYLLAGTEKGLFSIDTIPCAGMICYDIRFPEWLRAHSTEGAGIMFIPAEWPAPRIDHWRILLQSRAIENQCYIVACNRVGSDPNNSFGGHSMVIDPWGQIVAEAGEEEEILVAQIETDKIQEIRSTIPIFEDRRPRLYF